MVVRICGDGIFRSGTHVRVFENANGVVLCDWTEYGITCIVGFGKGGAQDLGEFLFEQALRNQKELCLEGDECLVEWSGTGHLFDLSFGGDFSRAEKVPTVYERAHSSYAKVTVGEVLEALINLKIT